MIVAKFNGCSIKAPTDDFEFNEATCSERLLLKSLFLKFQSSEIHQKSENSDG